jgi:hypothetical protein
MLMENLGIGLHGCPKSIKLPLPFQARGPMMRCWQPIKEGLKMWCRCTVWNSCDPSWSTRQCRSRSTWSIHCTFLCDHTRLTKELMCGWSHRRSWWLVHGCWCRKPHNLLAWWLMRYIDRSWGFTWYKVKNRLTGVDKIVLQLKLITTEYWTIQKSDKEHSIFFEEIKSTVLLCVMHITLIHFLTPYKFWPKHPVITPKAICNYI